MNNYYFNLKAHFILSIFKFLFRFFDNVEKKGLIRKIRLETKISDITIWLTNIYNTHNAPYLEK